MASDYERSGVRGQSDALSSVVRHLAPTLPLSGYESLTTFGHYASVIKLTDELAIAFSTDGVGSKTIIASKMGRYDTIGFDCVAMNVNDLLCVGARPVAMVDYLGVHTLDARRSDEILRGLGAAAKEASIAIPGGELAQLPEVIGSDGRSPGDETAFDLVGAAVGVLHPDELLLGADVKPGNAVVAIASSGIHSNGLTLARKVLMGDLGLALDDEVPELGRTLGEELLEPTTIYVRAVQALHDAEIRPRGMAHITSDGFTNLLRLDNECGYRFERLLEVPPIFGLLGEHVGAPEMFRVFNMGTGFVAIVADGDAPEAVRALTAAGYEAARVGEVTTEEGTVVIEPAGLIGTLVGGESLFEAAG